MGTQRKAGRPSDYTEELADRICEEIANSDTSLRQVCAKAGMPNARTVNRWLAQHEEFAHKYARAREGQADVIVGEMGEIERQVKARKLAPDAARVILQSKQWRASKLGRTKYGERTTTEVTGPDGGPIQTTAKIDASGLTTEQLRALASIPVHSG